ncbi:MAG: prepilin-type N-terminal cleavage/methylation domain-containing protein [Gammaproteobacteria bacterium]|jgi:type IV pilus assembly protein PilW|nr:prepilin-type N-terminal cleavage/methylation domain-containing protein [Gammaproteobacteria bacterium]
MQKPVIKSQNGFTLVEIMVAMVLSLILGVAIVTVFVNNSHSFSQDDNVMRMQDDARFALQQIAFDLSMAGHYAELLSPAAVTPDTNLAIGMDCGPAGVTNWAYQTTQPATGDSLSLIAIDNVTSAQVVGGHSCFLADEVEPGTDVVSIKRVAGAEAAVFRDGAIYLRTNGTVGLLYRQPLTGTPAVPVAVPRTEWEYRPAIYYIRQYAYSLGDDIPTLCRKVLGGAGPSMLTECIATGIENLQIEYGIDTSGDGNPNTYMSAPTLAELQNVVSARINLLARTTDVDVRYTNQKTFSIGNAPDYTPNDSFHRRVYSTTVAIQNIRSMNMMGF